MFLGFIIASIPLIVKSEINTLMKSKRNVIYLVIGIIVVVAMAIFNPVKGSGHSISLRCENLNFIFMIYIFVAGLIAISAMVLPGISCSTILLIFGLYAPILNSIKQILKSNFEYLPSIIIFCAGIVIGVLLTVRIVRYLLKTYRPQTMYLIIGLMIGSIYAVILGPTSLEVPKPPMDIHNFSVVFFVVGCVLVPGLEILKKSLKSKEIEFK